MGNYVILQKQFSAKICGKMLVLCLCVFPCWCESVNVNAFSESVDRDKVSYLFKCLKLEILRKSSLPLQFSR